MGKPAIGLKETLGVKNQVVPLLLCTPPPCGSFLATAFSRSAVQGERLLNKSYDQRASIIALGLDKLEALAGRINGDARNIWWGLMIQPRRRRALQAAEKVGFERKRSPQRLKPY